MWVWLMAFLAGLSSAPGAAQAEEPLAAAAVAVAYAALAPEHVPPAKCPDGKCPKVLR